MKKIFLALIMFIIVGICIPAVSAETLIDEDMNFGTDTSLDVVRGVIYGGSSEAVSYNYLTFNKIQHQTGLIYFAVDVNFPTPPSAANIMSHGVHDVDYTINGVTKQGVVYCSHHTNLLNQVTAASFIFFPYDWDIGTATGPAKIKLSKFLWKGTGKITIGGTGKTAYDACVIGETKYPGQFVYPYESMHIIVTSYKEWRNRLTVSESPGDTYKIDLQRVFDGVGHESTFYIYGNDTVIYQNKQTYNVNTYQQRDDVTHFVVTDIAGNNFTYSLASDDPGTDPDDASVIVYIQNSQTGAAIANSRCVIDALVDGDYYPVVNRTEPSGVFSVTLQPTGGGRPNPDGYRLIASAAGYNNPMPEINFTVDEYTTSIYCYLDPIAGGPLNENNTFIDFFVRDMTANPISGATVKFGDYTLLTNSQGYTMFEVDKNAMYTYTVSKSGYGSLTGNAVIGDSPRHTINTVLAPTVTPTKPTPIPTSTSITPNPTMTAPTGEPVSNWLDWFAAHFGMILGGGVEIGKIFMWLCFAVPVGVYVGKEAKAGAAGFMAGAGIVTIFFVLIGWVPIWLLVLLALIIGLLYAKVFNSSDTGGGR